MSIKSNNGRIEGSYNIVSVFSTLRTWEANDRLHRAVVDSLIRKGFRVQELAGKWDGVEERSIRIEGINREQVARELAKNYNQGAYMSITEGAARVISTFSGRTLDTFTQQVEVEDADNYTEVQGFRFTFI